MLLRFLSVLYLGACTALATQPQNDSLAHRSDINEIRLPCAPCAFADPTCSRDRKPNAFLVYSMPHMSKSNQETNVIRLDPRLHTDKRHPCRQQHPHLSVYLHRYADPGYPLLVLEDKQGNRRRSSNLRPAYATSSASRAGKAIPVHYGSTR